MTLDEMIKALSNEPEFGDVWIEEETCAAVVAALKAGQAMRNEVKYYYNDSTSGTRAWDAATTKGDV